MKKSTKDVLCLLFDVYLNGSYLNVLQQCFLMLLEQLRWGAPKAVGCKSGWNNAFLMLLCILTTFTNIGKHTHQYYQIQHVYIRL